MDNFDILKINASLLPAGNVSESKLGPTMVGLYAGSRPGVPSEEPPGRLRNFQKIIKSMKIFQLFENSEFFQQFLKFIEFRPNLWNYLQKFRTLVVVWKYRGSAPTRASHPGRSRGSRVT